MSKIVFFALLASFLPLCFATFDTYATAARLANAGNVVSLAQTLNPRNYSSFPGDPPFNVSIWSTIPTDGYLVEHISIGTHTGTHLSAPCHFIEGATCVDKLPPSAFVFVAATIDVTSRIATRPDQADFLIEWSDILQYEARKGQRIPRGAIVLLYTGFGPKFGTAAYDGLFPGFSGDAVEKLFRWRKIKGLGSDTYGPDASSDTSFNASYTSYANGGITIENMANLHLLKSKPFGNLIVAAPSKLKDGSGYQTNVLAFL